jgi:uncharacterized protein
MQAREMVPRFKQKDFPGGLVAGVQAIADHLAAAPGEGATEQAPGEYRDNGKVVDSGASTTQPPLQPVTPQAPQHVAPPPVEDDGVPVGPLAAGGAGLLGLGGGAALFARHRKRQRTCMKCQPNVPMLPLSEIADDAHLEEGQRKEEQLGSVDYTVVVCPTCQDARTLRDNKWFSGFSRCSSCSYKTLSSSSRTTVHATYDHGGQVEVTEDCRHCSYHNQYTRYTSKKTRPSTSTSSFSSSSRSSGGGSFGGGSSRGGGAGSSW